MGSPLASRRILPLFVEIQTSNSTDEGIGKSIPLCLLDLAQMCVLVSGFT